MFCQNCGAEQPDDSVFCTQCGRNPNAPPDPAAQEEPVYSSQSSQYKSRTVAGLLQILLALIGLGGVGRLYLGYTGVGVLQLLSVFACGAGPIWSIVDGILILSGSPAVDASGNPLRD